jgi:crotonobetainyl-CoA:carnitine CoA-transferase CaiB-like acyl-CoA transferase
VNFCNVVGKQEWLEDTRFESNPKRVENRDALLPLIDGLFAQKTCDEWMEILVGAAIPCGPVNNMQHLFDDPQVKHRGMIAEVPHPTIGTLKLTGVPIKASETQSTIRRHPPLLGEHTDEVLKDTLGYSEDQIAALIQKQVVSPR